MVSGSRSPRDGVLPRWIRPFHRHWKPLTWVWGGLLFGILVNVSSSWLVAKSLDLGGTPLGWGIDHPWITLPPLFLLVLFTLLAGLASSQESPISPASSFILTSKQRLQFIHGFEQEYSSRLASSLHGQVTLELYLHERTDVTASSANLIFPDLRTGQTSSLLPSTSIIEAYDRFQRGFLILGAPGSGKTTLLLSLAGELMQRAENDPDQPLAIILNLSSWAKTQLPLEQWLGEQCSLVYGIPKHLSVAWIAQEQVQFLLDGLDEIGDSKRSACIEAINTYRQAHLVPLVVCSRSQEYESQPARLILPGAVEIQPLELAQISQVLKQTGKSLAAVRAALRNNATLSHLLTTPLMLSIVILTYRDKTAKELPQRGSPQEQQRAIFELYVQRMLQRYQQHRSFSLAQMTSSLIWLAQQMQQRHLTEFHLESLQVDWLSTTRARITYRLVVGLFVGLVFGLIIGLAFGLGFGPLIGLSFGLVIWLLLGPVFGLSSVKPVEKFAWSWKRSRKGVGRPVGGLLVGLGFGLLVGLLIESRVELPSGLRVGLVGGLVFGLAPASSLWLLGGVSGRPLENVRLKPNQGIYTSGWNALRLGLISFPGVGLVGGLVFGLLGGSVDGLLVGPLGGLVGGLLIGLPVGLILGGIAYFQHYVLRWFLAQSRALPWRTVLFLEEAKGCILLQRVGGGYRFVHPLLQEYFSSLTLPHCRKVVFLK